MIAKEFPWGTYSDIITRKQLHTLPQHLYSFFTSSICSWRLKFHENINFYVSISSLQHSTNTKTFFPNFISHHFFYIFLANTRNKKLLYLLFTIQSFSPHFSFLYFFILFSFNFSKNLLSWLWQSSRSILFHSHVLVNWLLFYVRRKTFTESWKTEICLRFDCHPQRPTTNWQAMMPNEEK